MLALLLDGRWGHTVRGYHYTFLDMDGRTGAVLTLDSPSDDVACELANEMLSKSAFSALELRIGRTLIYRIGRTDATKAA